MYKSNRSFHLLFWSITHLDFFSSCYKAAKAFLNGVVAFKGHVTKIDIADAANVADALIAELQKNKTNE